jgi:hypothetical protein
MNVIKLGALFNQNLLTRPNSGSILLRAVGTFFSLPERLMCAFLQNEFPEENRQCRMYHSQPPPAHGRAHAQS